jgi:hypothetical protein
LIHTSSTVGSSRKGCRGAESGDGGDDRAGRGLLVGDQRGGAAEGSLGVAAQLFAHEAVGEVGVRGEVDALPPHALAHPVGDEVDGCAHPAIVRTSRQAERMFSTGSKQEGGPWVP